MELGILSACFSLKRKKTVNATIKQSKSLLSCKGQVKQITYENGFKDSVQTFWGNLQQKKNKSKNSWRWHCWLRRRTQLWRDKEVDGISMRTCERHVEMAEILIRASKLSDHILPCCPGCSCRTNNRCCAQLKKIKKFSTPHDVQEVSARDAAAAAAGRCLHQPGPGLQNAAVVAPCATPLTSVWA